MKKAHWSGDGNDIKLTMPIAKVDVEKRQVFGWASLDNIDTQRDLVDAEASREAFKTFRGNIREQHDEKKPVGRLVDFKEDKYFDPETNKFYQGIYVSAYVSKGAQDTWEKVLDGTLSGFSIGGGVLEYENDVDENGIPFRRVKKYLLNELSLVDNPANQLANVLSFQKVAGTEEVVMTGDLADITLENVFVCNKCLDDGQGVHLSSNESLSCPMCETEMIQIGFVESSDSEPTTTVKKLVDNHIADRKGGVTETMADENVVVEEATVETTTVEAPEAPEVEEVEAPAQTEEEAAPAEEEATTEVEEVADPLTEAVKTLRELTDKIEESNNARKEEVTTLRKSLDDLDARFEDRLSTLSGQVAELQARHEEFNKKFDGIDASISGLEKGLTEVDASTAMKKSADFDQSAEEKPKSIWAGSFLPVDSI